jgi:CRP-like cAMP-binding protein
MTRGTATEPMLSIIERAILLMQIDVFSDLSSEQVARIAAHTSEHRFEAGEALPMFEKGMFYVVDGRIEMLVGDSVVRQSGKGSTFGLAALLGPDKAQSSQARAAESSHVLFLPKEDFMDTVYENPEVAVALLRRLSEMILDLLRQVETLERQVSVPAGTAGGGEPHRDPLA